ncbi:MAG: DNA-directed RNA polymerase subunit K [Candidatus Nitrosocaldus sp.]|nr:DNA-directed RNA polymerase subunit K [Candidatus Nitrosocaldus sp.]MDW7999566.1 DNA-directed RNA polymerase subunit K [Candidatus Nitrosocaldus sp.]
MVEGGKPSRSKKGRVPKREEKVRSDGMITAEKTGSDVKDAMIGKDVDMVAQVVRDEGGSSGSSGSSGSGSISNTIAGSIAQEQQVRLEQQQQKSNNEIGVNLVEVRSEDRKVLIGPARLTRFERARIVGARALQLSLGAPPLIQIPKDAIDPISIAEYELNSKALPISIRRILPDGHYQDIPIVWLMN